MKEPPTINGMKFQVGMKLEAIDPLNLSSICVATVMKVINLHVLDIMTYEIVDIDFSCQILSCLILYF